MCRHMVLEVELALVTGSYNKRLNRRKYYAPIVPAYETHSFNTWNAKYHSLVMLQTIYLKSINR